MDQDKAYTQDQLKQMWEAARAAESPFEHLTFVSVLGCPGSGASTQCAMLAQHFGFHHVHKSSMMRNEASSRPGDSSACPPASTCSQQHAQMEGDDDTMARNIDVLKRHLTAEAAACGQKIFIIDGFIRNLAQLHYFEQAIAPIKIVVYLDHDDDTLLKRLQQRGLAGVSAAETLAARLAAFRGETRPVLEYLEKRATRAQMYCRVAGWEEDEMLAVDVRLGVEEALKKK